MNITERLAALRAVMKKYEIDVYYVPTNDFHGSEYLSDYFKCREYLSGFTGSAGTLIVLQDEAGLWTDGRYFLQAEKELEGSGITLYRSGKPGVPNVYQYISSKLQPGDRLGFDARVVSALVARQLVNIARSQEASVQFALDLCNEIWTQRPYLIHKSAYSLNMTFSGMERSEKLDRLKQWLHTKEADLFVLTALEDIAWLLNIRGDDIHCTPVVFGYFICTPYESLLYADKSVFGERLRQELARDGVIVRDYDQIYDYISNLREGMRIAMDLRVVNFALLESVPHRTKICDVVNPTKLWKAVKNPQEIANEKVAHVKDGIAQVRFLYWLKHNRLKMPLTEMRVAEKLESFRQGVGNYIEPSFDPISAYGEHGAIVHYSATEETDASIQEGNFLLMDTGAHYMEGTTDITRTVFIGDNPTQEQKKYYTAVLRGNLRLAAAKFLEGCCGTTLDMLARQPLWEIGCDYNHGTGHGVGYLLSVHEGPNAIRYRVSPQPDGNVAFEPGMITSNEPGVYLEGKFGIRLENVILCVPRENTEFGQFLGFETLTMVPFERCAIDPEQMTEQEIQLLNAYHQKVYETIHPYLSRNEAEWLCDICAPIV